MLNKWVLWSSWVGLTIKISFRAIVKHIFVFLEKALGPRPKIIYNLIKITWMTSPTFRVQCTMSSNSCNFKNNLKKVWSTNGSWHPFETGFKIWKSADSSCYQVSHEKTSENWRRIVNFFERFENCSYSLKKMQKNANNKNTKKQKYLVVKIWWIVQKHSRCCSARGSPGLVH